MRRLVAVALVAACALLLLHELLRVVPRPVNPLVAQLAPGAAGAIVRALGPDGLYRVGQVISENNRTTWYSGGTHRASGMYKGRPYGLAFDILIMPTSNPDVDARALRLQGIAAWHRGPGAPGGPVGMGPHIHCVWPGFWTNNNQNTQQISSFVHGYRALADKARPRNEWLDPSIRSDEIACVRRAYEGVHGKGSLRQVTTYDSLHRGD